MNYYKEAAAKQGQTLITWEGDGWRREFVRGPLPGLPRLRVGEG